MGNLMKHAASEKAVAMIDAQPSALGVLGLAMAFAGRKRDANKFLNEFLDWRNKQLCHAMLLTYVYIGLGGKRMTRLAWLEKAYEERS
jgi:hypothetical protein